MRPGAPAPVGEAAQPPGGAAAPVTPGWRSRTQGGSARPECWRERRCVRWPISVGRSAQVGGAGADPSRVHFERLVIEAGKRTYALDLHRRLTVIAGVGHLEREGLITELIGGLSAGRSGVHLEIASDAGQRYAIFRPAGDAIGSSTSTTRPT